MKALNKRQRNISVAFCAVAVLLLSACSGSDGKLNEPDDDLPPISTNGSDSAGTNSDETTEVTGDDNLDVTAGANTDTDITAGTNTDTGITADIGSNGPGELNDDIAGTELEDTATPTLVTFDITVPKYVSRALQVHIDWGADSTLAAWVVDESWTASGNLQPDSSYAVTTTFSDDNGDIVLARANATLTTTTDPEQTLKVLATEFDSESLDDDSDGLSNLSELLSGTNPLQPEVANDAGAPPAVADASVELVADKTFRIQWQTSPTADFYRVLENIDGSSGYNAISGDLSADVNSFDHRVALHRRVNARYMVEACNSNGCTLSVQQLIESLEGNLEAGIGYFKSDTPHERNNFGSAVSLSADGQTLAVGEIGDGVAQNNPTRNAGAVHVFQRRNGQWQKQQRLLVSSGDIGDAFGASLELSADGNTLVVGAPGDDSTATGVNGNQADNSTDSSGAAYVFVRSGDRWQQQAYLKASNTPSAEVPSIGFNDRFGREVAISADGRTIVAGATGEDSGATGINGDESDNSGLYTGAAYVFVVDNGTWSQQAYIKASTRRGLRAFGLAVSLNANGNTLAVTGYNPYTPATTSIAARGADYNTFFGAVYIFTRNGSTWQQQAILRPSNAENERDWHVFGDAIDLSDDGNTLVASGVNGVYVLERQGSIWQPTQRLLQSNPQSDSDWYNSAGFGAALSVSGDGSTVAISWPEESSASTGVQGYQGAEFPTRNSGAAYVFEKAAASWQQSAYLKAPSSSESLEFGTAISLDRTGDTLAISAENESSNAAGIQGDQSDTSLFGSGAVYLY